MFQNLLRFAALGLVKLFDKDVAVRCLHDTIAELERCDEDELRHAYDREAE